MDKYQAQEEFQADNWVPRKDYEEVVEQAEAAEQELLELQALIEESGLTKGLETFKLVGEIQERLKSLIEEVGE
jgi:hypothetical protein